MDTVDIITSVITFVLAYAITFFIADYFLRRIRPSIRARVGAGAITGSDGDNGVDIRANQAGVSDALIQKLWETKEQITLSEFRRLIHTYNFPHHGSWSHDGYQYQIYQMFQGDVERPCLVVVSRRLGGENKNGDPIIGTVYYRVGHKEEWQKRV